MFGLQAIFEGLMAAFWTMAYGLMVWNASRYGHDQGLYMPLVPGALNLAWELCSIFSAATLGRLVWLCLDVAIFLFNVSALEQLRGKCLYILCTTVAFLILWKEIVRLRVDLLLLSAFAIDITIGLFYVIEARRISKHDVYRISILRTLGDLFAWFAYGSLSTFIFVAGFIELLLNVFFIAARIEIDSNGGVNVRQS